jgi:hypothetical protein
MGVGYRRGAGPVLSFQQGLAKVASVVSMEGGVLTRGTITILRSRGRRNMYRRLKRLRCS